MLLQPFKLALVCALISAHLFPQISSLLQHLCTLDQTQFTRPLPPRGPLCQPVHFLPAALLLAESALQLFHKSTSTSLQGGFEDLQS